MTQNIRSLKNLGHNKIGLSFSGNHRINEIVSQGFYELRIDMSDFAGESRYAVYRRFSVGDESQGFKLLIEDYIGNAGCMSLDKNYIQIFSWILLLYYTKIICFVSL